MHVRRIIFSRKGFDSSTGGGPSPIIGGRPISLPIPAGKYPSETTYGKIGFGDLIEKMSNGNCTAHTLCHYDPMFEKDRCAFGQSGQMQEGHLAKQGVSKDDVFLFYGWFFNKAEGDHHRIFGYLKVEEVNRLGANPCEEDQPAGFSERHPHTIPDSCWEEKEKGYNTLYVGEGCTARAASPALRLTHPDSHNRSVWRVPTWLRETGLSCHKRADWISPDILKPIGRRGQEYVADISGRDDAQEWLKKILAVIKGGQDG